MDRTRLHRWRQGHRPAGTLHACPRRKPFQPRPQGQIRSAQSRRKSTKGRHHSHHAKAHRAGKRLASKQSKMGAKTRLIKTDTLVLRSQLLGWRITCTLCGASLAYPGAPGRRSAFGSYHAIALAGERLLHNEAERGVRTWASPAKIAQLLLMRRGTKHSLGEYQPWRYRVLGALIPDLDDAVERQSLQSSAIPILSLHLRPALLAGVAIVGRSGPEMLELLCGQMMGENKARFRSAIEEIISSSTCRSTASSQMQLI